MSMACCSPCFWGSNNSSTLHLLQNCIKHTYAHPRVLAHKTHFGFLALRKFILLLYLVCQFSYFFFGNSSNFLRGKNFLLHSFY